MSAVKRFPASNHYDVRGNSGMDHNEAIQQKAPERYLLNELGSDLRDQFEEHLFGCQDCALHVRSAAQFIDQAKVILGEVPPRKRTGSQQPKKVSWFPWLRPAFTVPALVLLLALVGYQNLVTYPHLRQVNNSPQLLATTAIHLNTYGVGNNRSLVVIPPGNGFILQVPIAAKQPYSSYRSYLYNPAGNVEFRLSIHSSPDETWSIYIPGASRVSGIYRLKVVGLTDDNREEEVGSGSFELQIKN